MSKPLTLNSKVDYVRYTRNNMRDVNLKRTGAPIEKTWWYSAPKFALTNGKMVHPSKAYRPAVLNPNLKKVSLPFNAESKYRTSMNAYRVGMGEEEEGNIDYRITIRSRPEVIKQIEDIEKSIPQYVPNRQAIIDDMVDKLLREIEKTEMRTQTVDMSIISGLRDTNARMKLFMDAYNERMRHEIGRGDKTEFGREAEREGMGEEEEEEEEEEIMEGGKGEGEGEDEGEDEGEGEGEGEVEGEGEEEEPAEEPSNLAVVKSLDRDFINRINPSFNTIIDNIIADFTLIGFVQMYLQSNKIRSSTYIAEVRRVITRMYSSFNRIMKDNQTPYKSLARQLRILDTGNFESISRLIINAIPIETILDISYRETGVALQRLADINKNIRSRSEPTVLAQLINANMTVSTAEPKRKQMPLFAHIAVNTLISLYVDALSPMFVGIDMDTNTGLLTIPKRAFSEPFTGSGAGAPPE
jgi:hypothetical protein